MKVIALISGGKDSTYNMIECVRNGHEIVALVNLRPPKSLSVQNETIEKNDIGQNIDELEQELDSYMYQSVGNELLDMFAQAMQLPLYRANITGKVVNTSLEYEPLNENDEVEDLYKILKYARDDMEAKCGYKIEAVSSGAIMSTYQKNRVENVCNRLGMQSLAFLWQRDQTELLDEMIESGIDAILVKVACVGLLPAKHLGKNIKEMRPYLQELARKYGVNVCGEGGEYESATLDCPLFKGKRIIVDESEQRIHSNDAFAPVGYLLFKRFHLQDK
jgi:diphthine-ammonia ligase